MKMNETQIFGQKRTRYFYLRNVYLSILLKKKNTPRDSLTKKNIEAPDSCKIFMHLQPLLCNNFSIEIYLKSLIIGMYSGA